MKASGALKPQKKKVKKKVIFVTPENDSAVAQQHWYRRYQSDGATFNPTPALVGDTTDIMIALLVFNPTQKQILLVRDSPSAAWYLPVGSLQPRLRVAHVLDELLKETQCAGKVTDLGISSVENYPSIKRNWLRLGVSTTLTEDCTALAEDTDALVGFHNISNIEDRKLELAVHDIMSAVESALDAKRAFKIPVPVELPDMAFKFMLVEVAVFYKGRVCLTRHTRAAETKTALPTDAEQGREQEPWGLPVSHISRAENLSFVGSRLCHGILKSSNLEMGGVIAVSHGTTCSADGHDGLRFTLFAISEQELKTEDNADASFFWSTGEEMSNLPPYAPLHVRSDLPQLLSSTGLFAQSLLDPAVKDAKKKEAEEAQKKKPSNNVVLETPTGEQQPVDDTIQAKLNTKPSVARGECGVALFEVKSF
jgi:hypothetical protein